MKKINILLIILMLFTVNIHAVTLNIHSEHAILYNLNDQSILYQKGSKEKTSIASLTKIMTAIIAIENINNLDDLVTMTKDDFVGLVEENAAVSGFEENEKVSYRDLLYGLMLMSGADSAQSLTRNIAGSTQKYVDLMNQKAKELGCKNTHFVNATGLDAKDHYSTVEDVAIIFQYALKNKDFSEMIQAKSYTTSNTRLTFQSTIEKAKSHFGLKMDYLIGGKTGTTEDAGYCLASIASYNGVNYMLITAKTKFPSKEPLNYLDAKTIYEYFMNHYSYQNVVSKKDKLVSIQTKYATKDKIDFYADRNLDLYLENIYEKKDLSYTYTGIKEIPFNMKKGTKLGIVEVYNKDILLTTVDIVLEENLKFDLLKFIHTNILLISMIILLCILCIGWIIKKTKK